jgi:hypothetical protein
VMNCVGDILYFWEKTTNKKTSTHVLFIPPFSAMRISGDLVYIILKETNCRRYFSGRDEILKEKL